MRSRFNDEIYQSLALRLIIGASVEARLGGWNIGTLVGPERALCGSPAGHDLADYENTRWWCGGQTRSPPDGVGKSCRCRRDHGQCGIGGKTRAPCSGLPQQGQSKPSQAFKRWPSITSRPDRMVFIVIAFAPSCSLAALCRCASGGAGCHAGTGYR